MSTWDDSLFADVMTESLNQKVQIESKLLRTATAPHCSSFLFQGQGCHDLKMHWNRFTIPAVAKEFCQS